MFGKITDKLRRIFGITTEQPAAKPAVGKKKKHKKTAAEQNSGIQDVPAKKKKKKKKKTTAENTAASASAPVVKAPVKPEALQDVPVCEGKTRFLDLPIHEDVQFGIQNLKFEYCTPIQAMTLPPTLAGKDIAGKAQTGTGKTAAFLITIFTKFLKEPLSGDRPAGQPRALVLAPTRELAIQIHKDAEALSIFTGLKNVVVFGGMDHEKQRRELLQPIDVLIGTPGRIIDYARGSSLNLSKVEVLVIDEADRMLDMGFIPDIKRIVAQLPRKGERQTMLFSATLEENILRLASGWLADPVVLESEPEQMVSNNIEQTFYSVLREEKLGLMLHILRTMPYERMIIFGNRKDVNSRLQHDLYCYGYQVPLLSGDIPQEKRIKLLEKFRTGEEKIIIATDVAARGIHVDDVSIVVNYDLPERPEDYVHRIGRTGRAGRKGISISFLCEYGAYNLPPIEEMLDCRFSSILPTEEMLVLPEKVHHDSPKSSGSRPRHSGTRNGGPRRKKW